MFRRTLGFTIPFLVLLSAVALRIAPGTSDYIQRFADLSFDAYQRIAPRPYTPAPVRIVDIDDQSLAELGQWPWSRSIIAHLVETLSTAGAASIAFDIVFAEPDRTSPRLLLETLRKTDGFAGALPPLLANLPDPDERLAKAMVEPNVVVGDILKDGIPPAQLELKASIATTPAGNAPLVRVKSFDGAVANLAPIQKAAKGAGFLNHDPEWDRVVRRVPLLLRYRDKVQPSLAAEAIRVAAGARTYVAKGAGASGEAALGQNTGMVALKVGPAEIPTDAESRVWLHYTEHRPERYIPARDILAGKFDPALIDGHIVLIGSTYAGGNDFVATPIAAVMPGVEVHAQLIEQVLLGWFLERPDWAWGAEVLFIVLAGLALILLLPRVGAMWSAVLGALAVAAAIGASWYAFTEHRMLFDPVYPAIVVLLVYGVASLIGYLRTEARQREIRHAFSHYMSPHLVDELARHPEKLVLGGEIRTMTLMFCDVRGFTTISEGLSAEELTRFMNSFLSPMTEIIMAHRGYIDKYIGDCIMAFWNAPLDDPEHAQNAVRAAQGMRRRLAELNAEWAKKAAAEGKPYKPLKIGIGINTGECSVGNMGSDQRFNYSVLGDPVNLASRLEGQGKPYGVDVVIGESTAALCPDWPFVELDLVAVKGKTKPVKIFTLMPDAEPLAQPAAARAPALAEHGELLAAYRAQDWATALRLLDGGLAEKVGALAGTYEVYRQRIETFLHAPPPPEWDGVYVATEK
jgi:adenylate cyclase